MANKILAGYPAVPGAKRETIVDHDGPASYTTDGETVTAAQFGLKVIEHMSCSTSDNAAHTVFMRPTGTKQQPSTSAKLVWIVVATGLQVANAVDLSGRWARLKVTGY